MKSVDVKVYDLDDTLCHFAEEFYNWMVVELGMQNNMHPEFEDYSLIGPFRKLLEINFGREPQMIEWLERFKSSGEMGNVTPSRLMSQFRKDILDPKISVAVVTARNWMGARAMLQTKYWFERQGIQDGYELIIPFESESKPKALHRYYNNLEETPNIVFIADDVTANIDDFLSEEWRVMLDKNVEIIQPGKPWNVRSKYPKMDIGGLVHG